ncbi:MAG: MerR family transcriptional regulator [Microbacteriaceae bacterium]|jgi:DNA-binding transcriptional MerR regulator|nr:MerR family transcriptional regulator [Microbacteriaceae bacterium]
MDWSIQEIARLSGTTSRTLRHYGDIGLLAPSRVGSNGYRYYDELALARLQRILMLRELGLGLPAIAELIDGGTGHAEALAGHLGWLRQEKERLDRQIRSVETTMEKMKGGEQLMAEEMLDGFDHTKYRSEVEERWGAEAYASGDRWYRSLTAEQRDRFRRDQQEIQRDYAAAFAAGAAADSDEVMAITRRHFDWIVAGWQGARPNAEQFVGLGDMYVSDERFGANYGGVEGATFVRDAMAAFARHSL